MTSASRSRMSLWVAWRGESNVEGIASKIFYSVQLPLRDPDNCQALVVSDYYSNAQHGCHRNFSPQAPSQMSLSFHLRLSLQPSFSQIIVYLCKPNFWLFSIFISLAEEGPPLHGASDLHELISVSWQCFFSNHLSSFYMSSVSFEDLFNRTKNLTWVPCSW